MFTAFDVRSLWISWRTLGRIPPSYSHHGSNPLATGTQTVHMPKKADSLEDPGQRREGQNNSWQHAQKMRASASHYYSIDKERGNGVFSERADGSWSGNPSLSDFLKQYMKALKRRKVSAYCTLFLIKCFKGFILIF